jgi:glucokinase-like ROK family protein
MMHILRTRAPISRAMLSTQTGLNKATVSDLVNELIKNEFVRELGITSSGTGRPATQLMLNPGAGFLIGCEIGVDFIEVMVTDFAPEVVWQVKAEISPEMGQSAILERLLGLLRKGIEKGQPAGKSLMGIAVGVPGMVDHSSGTVRFAPNLKWCDVPLRQILEQANFGAPVFVDNEANMAALGEYYFGIAQNYNEVLYLSANIGLGGGLLRDGKLCRGANGVAAEFGHMTMNPNGEFCNCGNRGCWETQVSQTALFRYIGEVLQAGASSPLAEFFSAGQFTRLTVHQVVDAAQAGDLVAIQALQQVGHYLGIGIASLLNALNPELVVLGGILSAASEFLLPAVADEIQKRALRWNREAVQIMPAAHGSDACAKGGIATIYQSVLTYSNKISLWAA